MISVMSQIWLDDEAKGLLEGIRKKIKEEGISQPSFGDAVRRLAKLQKEESPVKGRARESIGG